MTGGVYVAVFVLESPRRIRVGRLGRFLFPAARYAYVGSAQRYLSARVARHARRRKPTRWHVDYLTRWAPLEVACAWPRPKADECRLAAAVGALPGAEPGPVGFGASDCRCPTHLLRLPGPLDVAALAGIDRRWRRPTIVHPGARVSPSSGRRPGGGEPVRHEAPPNRLHLDTHSCRQYQSHPHPVETNPKRGC